MLVDRAVDLVDDLLHQLVLAGEVIGDDALADAGVLAIRASDAPANPDSAITSIADATIWARRASSMNERAFWPLGSFSDRMAKI